jgi:hypothetical protein
MKVLAVDVGGSHVKIVATGQKQKREIVSGPRMTARQMVSRVKKLSEGWAYDVVSVGFPGPVLHNRPVAEPYNLGLGWMGFDFASADCGGSTNSTGVPFFTLFPSRLTSQLVSRTQPWDSDLLTLEGLGVPWIPYPSAESPIQYDPTGLLGPGLMVNVSFDFTPLNL